MATYTRVTPKEILEMQRLYSELGNYSAVARRMGRSPSTVAKYIKMEGVPQPIKLAINNLSKSKEN